MTRLTTDVVRAARPLLGASFIVLMLAAPALAARFDVESRIDHVTVCPDAAQPSRIVEADIPAGAHTLVLKGLPVNLDPDSLRVEGAGSNVLTIGSIESRIAPAPLPEERSSLAARLQRLQQDRAALQSRLTTLGAQKAMIERYAQASPEKLGEKSGPMDVSQWTKAWEAVGDGLAKIAADTQTVHASIRAVEEEIRALQASNRPDGRRVAPTRDVSIEVESSAAAKVRLIVSYRIHGAGWRPVYDARLTTAAEGKPSLELVRRAAITQRTGEDWKNVALVVSTVRSQRGISAPDVLVERLKLYEPPPPVAPRSRAASSPTVMRKESQDMALAGRTASPVSAEPQEAQEQEGVLETGNFEAQFRIAGRFDIPGDGSSRSLRLGSAKIEPQLVVRVAPALEAAAYLEAAFKNSEDAPLLPGVVNIHRDGVFAGRGTMKFVAAGDETRIGFGIDDAVKVTRIPVSRRESGPGLFGSTRSETKDFRTTVRNLHKFPVRVIVADRIPVSEDAKITVEALSTNTPPTDKSVEGRRNVMGWTFDLAANGQREIRLGWLVKWPSDRKLETEILPDGAMPDSASASKN